MIELFSRRRWSLGLAQVVSCCIRLYYRVWLTIGMIRVFISSNFRTSFHQLLAIYWQVQPFSLYCHLWYITNLCENLESKFGRNYKSVFSKRNTSHTSWSVLPVIERLWLRINITLPTSGIEKDLKSFLTYRSSMLCITSSIVLPLKSPWKIVLLKMRSNRWVLSHTLVSLYLK